MNKPIFFTYCLILLICIITGIIKYKALDRGVRTIVLLIIATTFSELLSFIVVEAEAYNIRYIISHVFSIVEIILLSQFFIYAIKPYRPEKLIIATYICWPVIGLLNILFLQPLHKLNTNVLLLESFSVITMSLYYVYRLLKHDAAKNIFRYPHFQFAIISLVSWSCTFFFWAFIGVLYHEQWPYINYIMYGHAILNIIIYGCIAMLIFFYPKKILSNEYN